ncbi:MAG: DNA polymerase I, partial [Gemmatimonadales bacterium]
YADDASMSKRLVTIRTDVPLKLDLDRLRREPPDRERLSTLFVDLEFHTLARDFAPDAKADGDGSIADPEHQPSADASPGNEVSDSASCEVVVGTDQLPAIVAAVKRASVVGIRCVTSGDPLRTHLVGLGLAVDDQKSWYLSFAHVRSSTAVDEDGNPVLALDTMDATTDNLPPLASDELAELRSLLEDPDLPKWSSNSKRDLHALAGSGVRLAGIGFDSSLASYCLDPGKRTHDLEFVVLDRLGRTVPTRADVCGTGRSLIPVEEANLGQAAAHAAGGAAALLAVGVPMREDLDNYAMTRLLEDVELPLVPVLAEMERSGIRIDIAFFNNLHGRLAHDLELVQDEIYALAGGEVNLRSVPQMRTLLFEKLQLPVLRKTKTGPSTDESVLSILAAEGHAVPRLILEHRELDKLDSTYVRKLPLMVDPATGRIHSSFNQTVAATGRLSSSDPNLQNIPIRSSLGREIRKGFVPADGCEFLSADYSQVELRILAHLSADPAFVAAFRDNRDIHRETAARIFGVTADDVSPGMRDQAKTINFATIYGQGPVALAAQLGIGRQEAAEFITSYFERFEGVANYLETKKEQAKSLGFVETLLGRRRYIPEIRARNPGVRGFGERTATNSPIQGTAADLIKLAMIRIHERLENTPASMLLQVHDELLFETPIEFVDQLRTVVREEMEGAIELDVPLRVDIGVGKSWYLSKGV